MLCLGLVVVRCQPLRRALYSFGGDLVIRKLYKYMPLRLNFFNEPMLRATPIHALNDPFEADAQNSQVAQILRHLYDEGELLPYGNDDYEDLISDYRKLDKWFDEVKLSYTNSEVNRIKNKISQLGIVSFTEDYSNLLMWSHYVDQHRGMVIEFSNEVTWLKEQKSPNPDNLCAFNSNLSGYLKEIPERIIYRNSRPKFEFAIDVVFDDDYSKVYDNLFFSKGDSWLYEKEHRSILPLMYADKVIAKCTVDIEEISELKPSLIVNAIKSVKFGEQSYCELTFSNDNDFTREMVSSLDGYKDNDLIFLYRMNETFISSIYLGCRVTDSEVVKILDAIKRNSNFPENIIVKRAVISNNRYELDFEVISYPMLKRI
ncbi:DUF2971 domain-containing protein [Vibrio cholerae]